MGGYSGTVIRPTTGRAVRWSLAPGLAVLGRQLDALGITWYSIGDKYHLSRVGGHTPWKPSAPYGIVTAIDVMKSGYADVEKRILKLMKSAGYDTSFIDFINVNYSQYDWDGRKQGPSGDGHLHLEVLGSRTQFTSNLFNDMFGVAKPTVPKTTPVSAVTITWEDDDMFKFVKLRSKPEVYLVRQDGKLQHLGPAQLEALQGANLKALPTGADAKNKAKVTEPFVVENEAALAAFGTEIVPQASQVAGLD